MKFLVLQGPNLNMLGKRKASHYGTVTLEEIHSRMEEKAQTIGCELIFHQSSHEGDLVDAIHRLRDEVRGIIVNPAGLTGVGYSLRDAIEDSELPTIEVHLSNIHAREEFRRHSVFSAVAIGQIAGLRWRGYLAALEILNEMVKESG
jgi:3-dehydroquinate dehydratase-2